MKRYLFIGLLMAMLVPTAAVGQERPKQPRPQDTPRHKMQMRRMELELEEHEAELEFDRKMRELDLEERDLELEHQRKKLEHRAWLGHHRKRPLRGLFIVLLVVHILAAVWVYQDIRKRSAGSGIWIVLTLLTGLCGALVYALVRLGDSQQKK